MDIKQEQQITTNEFEEVVKILVERLEKHDENRKAVQSKLHEILNDMRSQIDELEGRINKELEDKFTTEDNRLQSILNSLRTNQNDESILKTAKTELLMSQSYKIVKAEEQKMTFDLSSLYKLQTEKSISTETIENRVPTDIHVTEVDESVVSINFDHLSYEETKVLLEHGIKNQMRYKCLLSKKTGEVNEEMEEHVLVEREDHFTFTSKNLEPGIPCRIKVKMITGDQEGEWSDETVDFIPEFGMCCVWKECPNYAGERGRYSISEKNHRIATKVDDDYNYCSIIGNAHLPPGRVSSWDVKILNSKKNNGMFIFVGVAPSDIEQTNIYNFSRYGWYLYCYTLKLFSGPPHNCKDEIYVPRKRVDWGKYVHNGDRVGVVVDTGKGSISFKLNGEDLGIAYEGIPLDKPLVPCVILECEGDSVELII